MTDMGQIKVDLRRYLRIGMKLSGVIQFAPNDQFNFSCAFVGMKDRQFMIFELSPKVMEELITRRTNNVDVVIKGLADTEFGHVIAFRSQIIGIKSLASWLMFVRYPVHTETRKIRENQRFKVDIEAQLKLGSQNLQAEIIDLSVSGCGLLVADDVDLEIGTEVNIAPAIKNLPEPLPKFKVVNLRKDANGTLLGIEFDHQIELTEPLKLEVFEHYIQHREMA